MKHKPTKENIGVTHPETAISDISLEEEKKGCPSPMRKSKLHFYMYDRFNLAISQPYADSGGDSKQ